jgi:hypothetical protein
MHKLLQHEKTIRQILTNKIKCNVFRTVENSCNFLDLTFFLSKAYNVKQKKDQQIYSVIVNAIIKRYDYLNRSELLCRGGSRGVQGIS